MPDIDMLLRLSEEFSVSLHELLNGQRLNDAQLRQCADSTLVEAAKESVFSYEEKRQYWMEKYKKDHRWTVILFAGMDLLFLFLCVWTHHTELAGIVGILLLVEHAWFHNQKMIYVENHLYKK